MKLLHLIYVTILSITVSSCNQGSNLISEELINKKCTIQFNRGDLGGGANFPVSPTTDVINGAKVQVTGKIIEISEKWIKIESKKGSRDYLFVPVNSILLIERHK